MNQEQLIAWMASEIAFKVEVARRIAEIDARIDAAKCAEGDAELIA